MYCGGPVVYIFFSPSGDVLSKFLTFSDSPNSVGEGLLRDLRERSGLDVSGAELTPFFERIFNRDPGFLVTDWPHGKVFYQSPFTGVTVPVWLLSLTKTSQRARGPKTSHEFAVVWDDNSLDAGLASLGKVRGPKRQRELVSAAWQARAEVPNAEIQSGNYLWVLKEVPK